MSHANALKVPQQLETVPDRTLHRRNGLCDMIGCSEPMHRVYEALGRVAPSSTTVMIRGESGTGKELEARAVVLLSPRAKGAFVSVNCGAAGDADGV